MGKRLLFALAAWAVFAAAGCDSGAERNGNNSATIGANAAFTQAPASAGAKSLNANVTREEFERDRSVYEQEARRLRRTVGPEAGDLWVWWKTHSALANAEGVSDLRVNVDVENGVVTLSGGVSDAARKDRAEQVARGVEGVREVKNNLTVGRL